MRQFGPFHRKEATFQTKAIAIKQVQSGEIWGKAPTNGGLGPTVQAYPGGLPQCRGVEFSTDVASQSGSSPLEARWYLDHTPGVEERFDEKGNRHACITADVVNCQP